MKHLKKLKNQKALLFLLLLCSAFMFTSCDLEELFEEEEEEIIYYDDDNNSGSGNQNSGYDYTFNCPVSGEVTIPIPPGTAECQSAYEYFSRVYACNDVENFNEANCRLCYDCNDENYCSVCE